MCLCTLVSFLLKIPPEYSVGLFEQKRQLRDTGHRRSKFLFVARRSLLLIWEHEDDCPEQSFPFVGILRAGPTEDCSSVGQKNHNRIKDILPNYCHNCRSPLSGHYSRGDMEIRFICVCLGIRMIF